MRRAFICILVTLLLVSCSTNKEKEYLFNDPSKSTEERVEDLLSHLTIEEKAGFMSGETMWYLQAVPRLGIPKIQVTDCGHGVTVILDSLGNYSGCATAFPTAVAQAASWDKDLIFKMGAALGRESRALGSNILLAPMVNIHRLPIGGRNYETYSEDPYLTGKLAAAFINGVQSEHVAAVIKSVTANNQQAHQHELAAKMEKRVLHEIYLPAFRMAVEEANPAGIMTAYNGINKIPTSESEYLISDVIKGKWDYQGFIVSDWRAVVSKKSISAGLDLEMPGPGKYMHTESILEALESGELSELELDNRIARYLRFLIKSKHLDIPESKLNAEFNTPRHHDIALEVAEGAIVLLKNDNNLLPLDKKELKQIGVFGPNAEEARLGGGGSASVTACRTVSPLKGLQNYFGEEASITFIEGAGLAGSLPIIPGEFLTTSANGLEENGLSAAYYDGPDLQGEIACSRIDDKIDFSWGWAAPCEYVTKNNYSVRWTGKINAPTSGNYKIGVSVKEGGVRLYLDNQLVIDEWGDPKNEITEAKFTYKSKQAEITMEKGSAHDIRLEFHKKHNKNMVRLEWELPNQESSIEEALKIAKNSDVAIIFAGLSNLFEGGNNDRTSLDLPGNQDRLISEVAKVNPNTIVVLINGTPVSMPWVNEVAAIVEAFYPGQEGGDAIARILCGEVNPSGKLPDTYPVSLEDNLAMKYYPGAKGEINYGEGLKVGYRQFEEDGIKPLFPFGFGLSYTQFEMKNLVLEKKGENRITVKVELTNTGERSGSELVQVYVRDSESSVYRPQKELKGFKKIYLDTGETKQVQIELDAYAFSYYSEDYGDWIVEPGEFEILVGNSSRDIYLKKKIEL